MGMRRQAQREVGVSGLHESYGRIEEDFLKEWNGQEKVKRVEMMLANSPEVGAVRLAYEMSIRNAEWYFTNGDETISADNPDPDSVTDPRLKLIGDSLKNMTHSWNDHISDMVLTPWYGWTMFTDQYDRARDGRLLWRKFKQLGNDTVFRWAYDPQNAPGLSSLTGLYQLPHLYREKIDIERLLIYRMRKNKNNPEGESWLRPAWIPFYYMTAIQEIEGIGIERNLAGLPMIEMPFGADTTSGSDDLTQAELIVRNVRNDEQGGLVLPPPLGEGDHQKWKFSLVSASGGSKVTDTDAVINRYGKRILMSLLTQFLMLGMDNVGAMSTFEGGEDFLTSAVNSVADMGAETFTKFQIPKLMKYNGYDPQGIKLEHTSVGKMDMDRVADFLQKTGGLVSWTPEDEVWLRNIARMPERLAAEIEEEMQQAQQARETARRQLQQQQPQTDDSDDDKQDDMSAYWFSDVAQFATAPDQRERDTMERKWTQRAAEYFNAALKRVERGAKELQ